VPQYGDQAQNNVGRSGASSDDNGTDRPEARSTTSSPASDDAAGGAAAEDPTVEPGTEPAGVDDAGDDDAAPPAALDGDPTAAGPVVAAPPAVSAAGLPHAVATPSRRATAAMLGRLKRAMQQRLGSTATLCAGMMRP